MWHALYKPSVERLLLSTGTVVYRAGQAPRMATLPIVAVIPSSGYS